MNHRMLYHTEFALGLQIQRTTQKFLHFRFKDFLTELCIEWRVSWWDFDGKEVADQGGY